MCSWTELERQYIRRGMPAALLVHGLTASPAQVGPQQEALRAAGFQVAVPLLPGHGTSMAELAGAHWQDWYQCVLQEAMALRARSGAARIHVLGISLGGLLGLKLAIDRPDLVERLVCIGVPLWLERWARVLLRVFAIPPFTRMAYWSKDFRLAVADPEGRRIYQASSYPKFSIRALRELCVLQDAVRRDLHIITTPLLLMHARDDRAAPPACAEAIRNAVAGPVELIWLERSRHVATLDYDKETINREALRFFCG